MWWFVRGRNQEGATVKAAGTPPKDARIEREDQLLAQIPDMSALDAHEVAVKVWLPEAVARLVKWMADYHGVSQSEWIRQRLIEYVYGRAAMVCLGIREARREPPMFSRRPVDRTTGRWIYLVPELGKNIVAFKVWMSRQMRQDLEALGAHAGVELSPFVREAIIGDLLGRGSLPERPQIIGAVTDAANAWERDEDVPLRQLEEPEFEGLGHAEREWVGGEDDVEARGRTLPLDPGAGSG